MTALNMAQQGVFGEVIRAAGAYIHTLEPFWDIYWKNPTEEERLGWRLHYNRHSRGDVYATHGLGPVAQVMNIHRGDRIRTLVAMDTKSVIGKELVADRMTKENIIQCLGDILPGGGARQQMLADYEEMNRILGGAGASKRAAEGMVGCLGLRV